MANNVGTTSVKLSRTIGQTTEFDTADEWSSITMITGDMDLGAIIYDGDGTMGVCTGFSRNEEQNPIYVITTMSLNTEIDVQAILSQSY